MKVEGSNITINDSVYNRLTIVPKGGCKQEGTPTPDYPQDIRVVTGDNEVVIYGGESLLPFDVDKSFEVNNVTFTVSNGILHRQGTASDTITTSNSVLRENFNFILPAGDYYLKHLDNYTGSVAIKNYNTNGDIKGADGKFTLNQETHVYFSSYLYKNRTVNEDVTVALYSCQTLPLHLGTNYLAGIGTYKDEIVGKTDEWKIKRYVGKANFKDLVVASAGEVTGYINVIRARLTNSTNSISDMNGLCSHFTFEGNYYGDYQHFYFREENIYLFIPKNLLNSYDATGVQTFLNSYNPYGYYALATETEETIIDTTLINSLNNMYQAMGYDGTTNITITSNPNNAQMTAEVTYTSESDMCEKLLFIFNRMKDKLYHIIRSL